MAPAAETPPRTRSKTSPNVSHEPNTPSEAPRFGRLGSFKQNGHRTQNGDRWVEPPLAKPVPSFYDYPGLSRNGVLETMMPLGTRPDATVRVRTKGDPLRKVVQARNVGGELIPDDGGTSTPEPNGLVSESTRAGTLRSEAPSPAGSAAADANPDSEAFSSPSKPGLRKNLKLRDFGAGRKAKTTTPSPAKDTHQDTPTAKLPGGFIPSPVPAGSPYFTAVALANKNNNAEVQAPLAFLYSAAEQDSDLAHLLQAATRDNSINDRNSPLSQKIKHVKRLYRAQNLGNHRGYPNSLATGFRGASGVTPFHADLTRTKSLSPSNFLAQPSQKQFDHRSSSLHNSSTVAGLPSTSSSSPRRNNISLKLRLNNPSKPSNSHQSSTSQPASATKDSTTEERPTPLRRSSSSSLSSVDSEVANQPTPDMAARKKKSRAAAAAARRRAALEDDEEGSPAPLPPNGRLGEPITMKKRELDRHAQNMVTQAPEDEERRARMEALNASLVTDKDIPYRESNERTDVRQLPRSQNPEFDDAEVADAESNETVSGSHKRKSAPTNLGRPPKSQKTTGPRPIAKPRTKHSPMKPTQRQRAAASVPAAPASVPAAGTAGVAQPESPKPTSDEIGINDYSSESSVNNDFCSVCFGKGYLLCCDGCHRSYHFDCLDPPLAEKDLDGPKWFCAHCSRPAGRSSTSRTPGLFTPLNNDNEEPAAAKTFGLPKVVKTYFDGVIEYTDGEYEKNTDTRKMTEREVQHGGINVTPTTDAQGKFNLCHGCKQAPDGKRPMISCDYCELHWHLDCTNPPMAAYPPLGVKDKKRRRTWMCPAHVQHDLNRLDPVKGFGVPYDDPTLADGTATTRQIRKAKNAKVVPTNLRRGLRNNGLIEVADETEDSTLVDADVLDDVEGPDGTTWKISRKGLILDFIDNVKQTQARKEAQYLNEQAMLEYNREKELRRIRIENERKLNEDIQARRFRERAALFNLASMSAGNQENFRYSEDEMINVIRTLEAGAGSEVIESFERDEMQIDGNENAPGLPSPPQDTSSKKRKRSAPTRRELELLLQMQDQIAKRLSDLDGDQVNPNSGTEPDVEEL